MLWKLVDDPKFLDRKRNYVRERNYFAPEREFPCPAAEIVEDDVYSVESISVSESEETEEDRSDSDEETSGGATSYAGDELSDIQKVLMKQKVLEQKAEACQKWITEVRNAVERVAKQVHDLTKSSSDAVAAVKTDTEGISDGLTESQKKKNGRKIG